MDRRFASLTIAITISAALAVGMAVFVIAGPSEGTSTQGGTTLEAPSTVPEEAETTTGGATESTSQEDEAPAREETSQEETPREQTSQEEASGPPEPESTPAEEAASPQEIEDALQGNETPGVTPSQGSLVEGSDGPELPEDFPAYSQVIGNTSAGNFEAPGWRSSDKGKDIHGKNYRVWSGSGEPARYEFEIPATGVYTLFAWWPSISGADSSVQVEITTGDGVELEIVDQTEDAGYWVPVGQYKMTEGESRTVEISSGEADGKVLADAVAVVRGIEAFPKNPGKIGNNTGGTAEGGETMFEGARWGKKIPRRSLMKRGKRHLGTKYVYGGRSVCINGRSMDCTCFTSRTYNKYRKLPDSPKGQWGYGRKISRKNLKRGDIVFFDENRNGRWEPWDHAGMYAGNGNIMHASSYFGKVVISKMKYINGFKGGKRIRYKKLRF